MAGAGSGFIAIGVPLVLAGTVLALLLDGYVRGIAAAIAVLGAIPLVVGLVLVGSAGVHRRERQHKHWA
jgi:predicted RNA methylase